jgi:hypothetical protein
MNEKIDKLDLRGLDLRFNCESETDRFLFVELRPGLAVTKPDGRGFPLGVVQVSAKSGEVAAVRVDGATRLFMSEVVKTGDPIKAGPDGRGVRAESGDLARAVCLDPGSGDHAGAVLLVSFIPWL